MYKLHPVYTLYEISNIIRWYVISVRSRIYVLTTLLLIYYDVILADDNWIINTYYWNSVYHKLYIYKYTIIT